MSLSANRKAIIRLSEYVHKEALEALFGLVLNMNVYVILVQKRNPALTAFLFLDQQIRFRDFKNLKLFLQDILKRFKNLQKIDKMD